MSTWLALLLTGCGSDWGPAFDDKDGDGVSSFNDCDDNDANVKPGAAEICDGIDSNCDGFVDDDLPGSIFFMDADGDTFGDPGQTMELLCYESAPEGYVENSDDCDDNNDLIYPDADELCDGLDNDCDTVVDEDIGTIYYQDDDGDGFGQTDQSIFSCSQPSGYSDLGGDCDDTNINIYPGAPEECGDPTDMNCDGSNPTEDLDGDGYASCEECDDSDVNVNPDAIEYCDGIDNNCVDGVDEDSAVDALTWYGDNDSDGFGDAADTKTSCSQPLGYVSDMTDCDDTLSTVYPGADEYCNGYDDDCDSQTDESDSIDADTWYLDDDTDGYGDPATSVTSCTQPVGYVANSDDCDDTDPTINPDLVWYEDSDSDTYGNPAVSTTSCTQPIGYVDNSDDCDDTDGTINPDTVWYEDVDTDGYGDPASSTTSCTQPLGYVNNSDDCNDADATLNPDTLWYADTDTDGFGDPTSSTASCTQPIGYVSDDTDCDDTDGYINPNTVWYLDNDSDGYGDPASSTVSCTQPIGYVLNSGDCDDNDATVIPDTVWYYDSDSDGYGDPAVSQMACTQPTDYVDNSDDCDDTDATINPDTVWYYDSDSDGYGDSATSTTSCTQPVNYVANSDDCDDANAGVGLPTTWYADSDSDGFGDDSVSQDACTQPGGYVADNTDCDDTNASLNPDTVWYFDSDGDGYGDGSVSTTSCTQPTDYVSNSNDCDDTEILAYTGAAEVCDGVDNNCVGGIDEGVTTTAYVDVDGDTFGDSLASSEEVCDLTGYSTNNSDCDDSNDLVYPGATDTVFDGVEASCTSTFEQFDADLSGIQFTANSNDSLGYGYASLANVGDVNGDTFDDFVGGIEFSNSPSSDVGVAALFYGGNPYAASTSMYDADVLFSDVTSNAYAGNPVIGAGDVNNDTYADFAVSARGADAVYLIHGGLSLADDTLDNADAVITGIDGVSLASGNHDGDSYSDLVIGDKAASAVYVFDNNFSGALTSSDATATLTAGASDAAGSAMVMHDIDGDGDDDLIVGLEEYDGAPGTDTGRVCVELAPLSSGSLCSSAHFIVDGASPSDYIGQALWVIPDVDGDSLDELAIGAGLMGPFTDSAVYIFSGADVLAGGTVTTSSATVSFTAPYEGLGFSGTTGDLDNDGYGDYCFGSYLNDDAASNAGKVDCFLGPNFLSGTYDLTTDDVTSRLLGLGASHQYGRSVLLMDLDGDGAQDLITGAPGAGSGAGLIYVTENGF